MHWQTLRAPSGESRRWFRNVGGEKSSSGGEVRRWDEGWWFVRVGVYPIAIRWPEAMPIQKLERAS